MSSPRAVPDQARNAAFSAISRHADNPSAFLALNQGNELFTAPHLDGFIAYREVGRCWIQFGGPFAAADDRAALLQAFLDAAGRRRRRVLALQLQHDDATLYAERGMRVNQIGASYAVELSGMTLRGKRFVRLRNKISRATRAGLEIAEVDAAEHADRIEQIDRVWLRQKGRHVRELQFLVGEIGGPAQEHRRLFLGTVDGVPVGYVSYAPVHGSRPGWLHDLSRRVPDAPPGVMEAINFSACQRFREGGAEWLHFGFTPFTSLDPVHEMTTASAPITRIVGLLGEHGSFVYPSATQLEYKLKWYPEATLPEYMAYDGWFRPRLAWALLRVTNSI
ncbi:bifunctional lysylphosphatidylglycerol flippase/synthetase MprF [Rhodococcus sp. NPDC003318]|uniref:bifunctional lysylphosphatidylglycerol flippase/synthetase MprF n=1 Tax=Rhodococcus sp. NPDC003318 TaxID=3364503 RepID=UPI003683970F